MQVLHVKNDASEVLTAIVVKMAPHPVARGCFDEWRLDVVTRLEPLRTARGELAPGRQAMNVGHGAGNRGQPLRRGAVDARQRREQPARVGMQRVVEQLANRRDLLNLAAIHDGDAVARFCDDREVVGDEQDRACFVPRLHLEHQVEDLRLNRHVERGGRLVGDQQRRD